VKRYWTLGLGALLAMLGFGPSRFGLNTWFVIAVCVVALLLINRRERRNDASMTRATVGIAAQDESSGR